MSLLLVLIGLFIAGLIQDAMSAWFLRLVGAEQFAWAGVLSVIHTLIGYLAWIAIVSQFLDHGFINLLVYAIGGGVGTYLGFLKRQPIQKDLKS